MLSPFSSLSLPESWTIQSIAALAFVASVRSFEQRPRGWLARPGALKIGQSLVPGAGRGVFATETLASGTVLGTYPGRLVLPGPYLRKINAVPRTSKFCWTLGGDRGALDPTDANGKLCEPLPLWEAFPFIPFFSVDTTLALINEPGSGYDVNVKTEEMADEVYFYTERQISAGEELFLDYGQKYDRSEYGTT